MKGDINMNYREMFLEDYFDDTDETMEDAYLEGYTDMMSVLMETEGPSDVQGSEGTDYRESKKEEAKKNILKRMGGKVAGAGKAAIGGGLSGARRGVAIGGTAAGAGGAGVGIAGLAGYKKFKKQAPDMYEAYKQQGGDLEYADWFKQNTKKYKAMMIAGAGGVAAGAGAHAGARLIKGKTKENAGWDLFDEDYDCFDEDYDYFDEDLDEAIFNEVFTDIMIENAEDPYLDELQALEEVYEELLEEESLSSSQLKRANKKLIKSDTIGSRKSIDKEADYDSLSTGLNYGLTKAQLKARAKQADLDASSDYLKNYVKTKAGARQAMLDNSLNYSKKSLSTALEKKQAMKAAAAKTALSFAKTSNNTDPKKRKVYENYVKKCISKGIKPESYSTFSKMGFFGG